jgi:hypothetical protein
VLAARPAPANISSVFSSSKRSFIASFLFLKQNNIRARTVPIRSKIPIASPALPPALIPPDDDEAEEVELAADAVDEMDEL